MQTSTEIDAAMRPLQWNLIARIFGLMRPYRVKRNWLLLVVLLRALQQPAFGWAVGAIIDGPIAKHSNIESLCLAVSAFFVFCIFMQITLHYRQRLTLEIGEAVVNDLRRGVFNHLQRMPMSYFHRTKIGRILSRVSGDCNAVRIGVQDVLFVSLVGVGQMFFAGLLMAYYSIQLFLIVVAMTPVFWLVNKVFQGRLGQAYREIQESFSKVTSWIAENISGMKITQAFVRGRLNAERFRTMINAHAAKNMIATRTSGLFLPIIELNSQLFMAALIAVGGYLALSPDKTVSLGDLIQFFFLASIFFNPIQILASQYNQALTAMAGAERVFELLELPTDPVDAKASVQLSSATGHVVFENVTFGYDPGKPVLRNISFEAKPGQTVAFVGHSGSGKTSITNLLTRFYSPNSGRILLDGVDLATISRDTISRFISLVPQQNYLFTGSIADNLRFAWPEAKDDDLWDALCALDCYDIIEKLPDGLDSHVGSRGSSLSAGQRQFICLTRALLAEPQILILDEATSSIDSLTELKMQKAIARLQSNRTMFVVAHRLSTIKSADKIIVLQHGEIVQQGTHEELSSVRGEYAEMLARYTTRIVARTSN